MDSQSLSEASRWHLRQEVQKSWRLGCARNRVPPTLPRPLRVDRTPSRCHPPARLPQATVASAQTDRAPAKLASPQLRDEQILRKHVVHPSNTPPSPMRA